MSRPRRVSYAALRKGDSEFLAMVSSAFAILRRS